MSKHEAEIVAELLKHCKSSREPIKRAFVQRRYEDAEYQSEYTYRKVQDTRNHLGDITYYQLSREFETYRDLATYCKENS